jgi:oligosaccharide repeat unit polymerase
MQIVLINMLGCGGAALLLFLALPLARDFLPHLTVFSAAWGLNIAASQIIVEEESRPEVATLVIVYLAWWAFLVGGLVSEAIRVKRHGAEFTFSPSRAKLLLVVLVVLQAVAVAYELKAVGVSDLRNLTSQLSGARNRGEFLMLQLPPIVRHFRWASVFYIPIAFLLYAKREIRLYTLLTVFVWGLGSSFLHFTRAPVLLTCITVFVSWVAVYPNLKRLQAISATCLIGALAITGAAMEFQLSATRRTNVELDLQTSAASYLGGSIKAYEGILQGDFDRTPGWYSIDFLNLPLSRLGIVKEYPDLIRPYTPGPLQTNLYTYLDAFTLDLGPAMAILLTLVLGLASGKLYDGVRRRSDLANLAIYSYVVYACAMSIANNEIIRFSFLFVIVCAVLFNQFVRTSTRHSSVSEPNSSRHPILQC